MILPVGPFVRRALRVDARSGQTYLLRALVMGVVLYALMTAQERAALIGAPGLRLFRGICTVDFWLICLSGPMYFAAIVADERQAGSLDLLRVAGLGCGGILMGLLGARMLSAITLLLAQVPFVVLCITMGGVSLHQVAAAYVALLAHLLMVGAVATSLSARGPARSSAASDTMLHLALILPFTYRWSAMARLAQVLSTGFRGGFAGLDLGLNLLIAAGYLATAPKLLERDSVASGPPAPERPRSIMPAVAGRPIRLGRPWRNALAWKDYHLFSGGRDGLLSRAIVLAEVVFFVLLGTYTSGASLAGIGIALMVVGLGATFIELFVQSSRVLSGEWRWGTLGSILILPLPTYRVVLAKLSGCMVAMAPYGVCLAAGALLSLWPAPPGRGLAIPPVALALVVGAAIAFLYLAAYMSVRLRRAGVLVALVLALPLWGFVAGVIGSLRDVAGYWTVVPWLLALVMVLFAAVTHVVTMRRVEWLAAIE